MTKDEPSNQLNLTVVALVALVAIVGLVALVMNAAGTKTTQLATGSQLASATDNAPANENVAGQMRMMRLEDCNGGTKPDSNGNCPAGTIKLHGCCV